MTTIKDTISNRIIAIDALRGLVMLLMLIDHVREYFYLHLQVSDPINIETTDPALFFSRFSCHICAPIFVFLSGLSAYLYGQKYGGTTKEISKFLFTRGVFLVLLEIIVINFGWTFTFPPTMLYLQVIWAIGMSMVLMSLIIWLPFKYILAFGVVVICGHNLLTPINFSPESIWYIPWAIIHDRSVVELSDNLKFRTSYQILPWVGIMALGYCFGKLYTPEFSASKRQNITLSFGVLMLVAFFIMRSFNFYGETYEWQVMSSTVRTIMSFVNLTKYPASLFFVLITLGTGAIILWWFEKSEPNSPNWMHILSNFGKAPLFFYIIHLYILHMLYIIMLTIFGPNHGLRFSFNHIEYIWILALLLMPVHYYLCKEFLYFKKKHKYRWLSYL